MINKINLFVKFPIIFPVFYGFFLYTFPQFETQLIFVTILLLAETHFGATWPFFLNKVNYEFINSKKLSLISIPVIIVFFSLLGFFFLKSLFLLIFFAANVYHVTRQSFGICKLYCKNLSEKETQENLIYFFNILFFIIAFCRYYVSVIKDENLLLLNIVVLIVLTLMLIFYIYKYGFSENVLTLLTGCIIFYPICFVNNPVHAIIMGVTMHYTQYLYLTHHVYKEREIENNSSSKIVSKRYFLTIIIYATIMSVLSMLGKMDSEILKNLIIVPIVGQMTHFYLDSQLWKFSEKNNRENVLRHINNM